MGIKLRGAVFFIIFISLIAIASSNVAADIDFNPLGAYANSGGGDENIRGAAGFTISRGLAYLATSDTTFSNGLVILNITNKTNPSFVGEYVNDTGPYNITGAIDVEVANKVAYVATTSTYANFVSINVSDPTNPIALDVYNDNSAPYSVAQSNGLSVSENYAYVPDRTLDSITIINITDPSNLNPVSEIRGSNYSDNVYDVLTYDNVTYIAAHTRISIFNVTNKLGPSLIGTWESPDTGTYTNFLSLHLDSDRNILHTSTFNGNAYFLLNVTDLTSVVQLDNYTNITLPNSVDNPNRVYSRGNYSFVTSRDDDAVTVFNITDPSNIVAIGDYNKSLSGNSTDGAFDVYSDNKGYIFASASVYHEFTIINGTILYNDNSLPTVNTPVITPSAPEKEDDLNCNFTLSDNEDTELLASVKWYKGTTSKTLEYSEQIEVNSGIENSVNLSSTNTTSGDTWTCGVTPYDYYDYGVEVNSSSKLISTYYVQGYITLNGTNFGVSSIQVSNGSVYTASNGSGYYSLPLDNGEHNITFTKVSHETNITNITMSSSNVSLNITLVPDREVKSWRLNEKHTANSPLVSNISSPGILWRYNLGGEELGGAENTGAIFADVDGDNFTDIIMQYGERLIARNYRGHLLWESKGDNTTEIGSIIGVYDLNNDGHKEILVGTESPEKEKSQFRLGRFSLINGTNGDSIFTYDYFENSRHGTNVDLRNANVKEAQIDGDSDSELIIMPYGGNVSDVGILSAFDFTGGDLSNGVMLWNTTISIGTHGTVLQEFGLGDVNNDTYDEVIAIGNQRVLVYSGKNGSNLYNSSNFDSKTSMESSIIIEDLDNDNISEVVAAVDGTVDRVIAFNADSDSIDVLWDINVTSPTMTIDSVSDVDNDGDNEVVFSHSDGVLVVNASNGNVELNISSSSLDIQAVEDLNGDNVKDIVYYNSSSGFNMMVWNGSNDSYSQMSNVSSFRARNINLEYRANPSKNLYNPLFGTSEKIFTGDTDGDGIKEIFGFSGSSTFGYEVNGSTADQTWNITKLSLILGIEDLDKDDKDEVIFTYPNGTVSVYDENGEAQFSFEAGRASFLPLISDINNDGYMEIIIYNSSSADISQFYDSPLVILNVSLANETTSPTTISFAYTGNIQRQPSAGNTWAKIVDLDGTGNKNIVARTTAHNLTVFNYDGSINWSYLGNTIRYFNTQDFDNDGIKDVILTNNAANYTLLNGTDGSTIWSVINDSTHGEPTILDINDDGFLDVIAKGQDTIFSIYGNNGSPAWWTDEQRLIMSANGHASVGDVDADGVEEIIVVGGYTNTWWEKDDPTFKYSRGWSGEDGKAYFGSIVDINGDGAEDLVQSTDHALYAYYGNNGSQAWNLTLNPKVAFSHTFAGDVDEDGNKEILVSANNGKLYSLNSEDGSVLWEIDFGYNPSHPIIGDVDNDGESEILVTSNGYLYALDKNQAADLNVFETDIILSNNTPISGTDVSVSYTVRNWGSSDANNVPVQFYDGATLVDNRTINVERGNKTTVSGITWSPNAGETNLSLIVNSNLDVVENYLINNNATRGVNVSKFNFLPGVVTLNSPESGNITNNRTPLLTWNEPTDLNGDSLTYNLLIDDDGNFGSPLEINDLNDLFYETSGLSLDISYYWKVNASDGIGTGNFSDVWNFTINSQVVISLPNSTASFGTILRGNTVNTTSGDASPFIVQNDGNVMINISVNSTNLFSSVTMPDNSYNFKVNQSNETGAFDTANSLITGWTLFENNLIESIIDLKWQDSTDSALLEIQVTPPEDELAGSKSASVTFFGEISE